MNKCVNIEVLLKAAEFIEQANIGNQTNSITLGSGGGGSSQFCHTEYYQKNDCVGQFNELDQIKQTRIFNNSLINITKNNQSCSSVVLDNINKYLNSCTKNDHKRSDEDDADEDEDVKPNINRNKTTHNILEKNRRAHLKECFENLQNELPLYKDKKVTNLLILKQTCKYLEQFKKKEKESALEIKRLLAQNIALIEHLNRLKNNFGKDFVYNFDVWINQNSNKLKEIKMLNYNANYTDQQEASNGEENSKKFDSFESEESSEFDSEEYNENSKSN